MSCSYYAQGNVEFEDRQIFHHLVPTNCPWVSEDDIPRSSRKFGVWKD